MAKKKGAPSNKGMILSSPLGNQAFTVGASVNAYNPFARAQQAAQMPKGMQGPVQKFDRFKALTDMAAKIAKPAGQTGTPGVPGVGDTNPTDTAAPQGNRAQLRSHLHGFIKGLTEGGLSHDEAQKYLYQELQDRAEQGKQGYQDIAGEAYAKSVPGQIAGSQNDPAVQHYAAKQYRDEVIVPYATDQLQRRMALANAYAEYQARGGAASGYGSKKTGPNPFNQSGETKATLGIPAGVPMSAENIQRAALTDYYNNTGDSSVYGGDQYAPGPPNLTQKGTVLAGLLANAQKRATSQTKGAQIAGPGSTPMQILAALAGGHLPTSTSTSSTNLANADDLRRAGIPVG